MWQNAKLMINRRFVLLINCWLKNKNKRFQRRKFFDEIKHFLKPCLGALENEVAVGLLIHLIINQNPFFRNVWLIIFKQGRAKVKIKVYCSNIWLETLSIIFEHDSKLVSAHNHNLIRPLLLYWFDQRETLCDLLLKQK